MATTNCPECGAHGHLYTAMEFKLKSGAWSHTGWSGDVECTVCDREFNPDEIDVPALPGLLPVDVIERVAGFLEGFEDDHEQEGVVELLEALRAALGREA